jgi:hypothetical protein
MEPQMRSTRQRQPLTAFEEAVQHDIQGRASDGQAALLLSKAQEWLDALIDVKRNVELQFARRRAEIKEFQQACLSQGPEAKSAYFQHKTDYESWRAKALGYATVVERRTKHVRRLVDENPKTHEDMISLCQRAYAIIVDVDDDIDTQQWLTDYDKVTRKAS